MKNETIVDRGITFLPVFGSDHIKQIVRFEAASKSVPDMWISMRVRSENFGSSLADDDNDSTKLADGRPLSDLTVEITLRALLDGEAPLQDSEATRVICGFMRYDGAPRYGGPDYSVMLYLSIQELHQVAELTRTRWLSAIHVEFQATLAPISEVEPTHTNVAGVHPSRFGQLAYYVWNHHDPIPIDRARIEFEFDRAPGAVGTENVAGLPVDLASATS